MATANLGVRVVLQDAASGGFNALGIGVGNLIGQLGMMAWAISTLPENMQAAGVAAAVFGLAFEGSATALNDVVQAAMGLQNSMAQISVNVKGAGADITQLQNTINQLADYSIYSSQEVADGFVLMGQKGYDASQIISGNMGKAMVDLAESINSGPVPAAKLLSSAMQIWKADASQAAQYADMLSFAFHNGVPDANALQLAIGQAGQQASQMGIPFSDFVTALDEMGQRGLTASQAALSLKNVLIGLSDPTTKAQKELADLGVISVNDAAPGLGALVYQVNQFNKVPLRLDGTLTNLNQLYTDAVKVGALHTDQSFYQWASSIGAISNNLYDAQGHFKNFDQIVNILSGDLGNMQTPEAVSTALEQLFNRTALKGGQIIFDTGDSRQKLNELRQALQEYISGGGSAKDAATITQTASARMKELGSTVHSAAAQIGTSLLPIISNVAGGINNWANMMRTHHPELLKFIGIVLVLATVFTGIGTVVAGAILFFTAFATVIGAVAVPALLIAGAIAGLIVVVALVVTHFSQIKAVLAPIGDLFGTIAGFVGSVLGPVFGQLGQQWGKLASMVLPELKSAFGDIGSALGSMGTLLGSLTPVWDVLKVVLIAVGAVVGVVLAAAFSSIIGIINAVVHALAFIIMGVADVAKGLIGFVSGALSFFINGWKMMIQIVIALFTGHFNEIPKIITSLGPKLLTSLLTMVQGIGNVLKGAFFGLVGSLGAAAWGMFSGVLGTLGNIANTIFPGIGKNLVQGLLNGLLGGPKALGDWFKGLWDNLLNQIRKMLGIQSPSTVFSDMGNNIIQGLINGLNKLVGSVPTILKTLATNMLAAVADLPKQFADLAGHIIDGLANGIKNGAGKVASGLGHVKDGIISGFKSGFGIFSPSKVMAELGTFVSQGLIVGIQSVDVGKQANDHFAKVKPDANSLIHTPGYAAMHAQSTVAMHNASGYGQGDLTIPLVVDGKTMAQVTIDRWTGQLKSNGVGRKLR